MADIFIAACDLDKTVYPPAGPFQLSQLRENVNAMDAFERCGGLVFPVTGNNLLMAQVKFEIDGRRLRELHTKPGVFMNGGLVLGPGGVEIERHALGHLRLKGTKERAAEKEKAGTMAKDSDMVLGMDFVTAVLDFWDAPRNAGLTEGVGLLFITPRELLGYAGGYANVEAYCDSQRVQARKSSRAEIVDEREQTLLLLLLFPRTRAGADLDYDKDIRPWQMTIHRALELQGLFDCETSLTTAPLGVGRGVKTTLQSSPWPEIDVNVAGVDKGSALARFLQAPEVTKYLGLPPKIAVEPAKHVAVFGDAANDVPMFEAIGSEQPALRVVMPHASDARLIGLATERAEVAPVLQRLCKARQTSRHGVGNGAALAPLAEDPTPTSSPAVGKGRKRPYDGPPS